jgi:hypothetical protein
LAVHLTIGLAGVLDSDVDDVLVGAADSVVEW